MKISNAFLRRSAATIIGMLALHSASSQAARCEYVVQNEWGNGFVAAVRITNDTGTAISNWSVNWSYSDGTTRTGGWNANISGNNPFTATGVGWNNQINPGQTIEFGVQGNKGVANQPAQRPAVTGAVCSSVTPSSASISSIISSSSAIGLSSSSAITLSSSSIRFSSSSSTSSGLYCPQGNSWPDCPWTTWSPEYCAKYGPPSCRSSSSTSTLLSSSSSSLPVLSSSKSSSSAPLSCPQGNSWPDCPSDTWSDAYCAAHPSVCIRSSSSIASSRSSSSASSVNSSIDDMPPLNNPFAGATWYVDPIWSAKASSEVGGNKVARFNTAVWMDRIGAIAPVDGSFGLRDHLDAALAQGANLIQVVVYDLPNRDCHALASNGELTQGANGTVRYRTEYVDALAAIFSDSKYRSLRIIAIIEPDSLPNLVTNLNDPECQLATDPTHGYVANTQYTLNKFYPIPNVYSYVDIGHSGWLGWDTNFNQAATLIGNAIKGTTNGVRSIAGFVSNTSGYTPNYEPFLDSLANSAMPGSGGGTQVRQAKFYEWNPQFSEVAFVQAWRTKMIAAGFPSSIGMLIDTSRNGWGGASRPTAQSTSSVLDTFVDESRVDRRLHRGNWCNQPGGIGETPRAAPAAGIDAYVWVKPPGESDGASSLELSYDPLDPAKGFDRMCDPTYTLAEGYGSGALANAPVAGRWFPEAFQLLVKNAYPPLDAGASSSSSSSNSVRSSSSSVVVFSSIASSAVQSSSPIVLSSVQSSSIASSSLRSSSSAMSSSKSSSSATVISSSSVATSSSSSSLPDVVRTDCPAAPPATQFGSWAPYNTNDESQKVVKNYRELMVKMPVFNNGVIPLPYNLHQPEQAAANPQAKYPLVIYLHGGGERGSNEEHLSSRHALPFFASSNSLLTPQNLVNKPAYIVAPQCNCDFYSNEWSSGGGAPFSISGSPSRYGKALTDLIDHLAATYQIDRDRIYVTGISMGGGGSWELAARRPDLIAAAVPMSGYPVSTTHAQAVANSKVVIWPQQGEGDENNSISGTQTTVSAIAQAKGCAYMNTFPRGTTLEVDPGDPPNGNDLQHTVWMRAYMNPQLWDYVFSIKRAHTGVASSSVSSSSSSIRSSSSSQLSSVLSSSKSSSSVAVVSSSVISSSIRSSSSVAVVSSASSSSIADRNLYTARKAQVAPVIDGTADAVWEQASWAPINVFWLGTQANPSAADYTGQYKALWDANYLYLLFDVTDDRIYDRTRDALSNYWEDDTVELFIDENKNGGQHQYNTSAWAYHVSTYGDVVDYTTSGPKLLNDHIDVRLVSLGDKHMWEMRVRIYGENYSDSQVNTPLTLTAGKLMGFSASYIDNDGSAQRESMMGSVDTAGHKNNQGYLDASVFGSLKLVE